MKEHIIPVFSRVAPFPRDFPFRIHSHLPTRAVQFTILSIIASRYKIADAFIYPHYGYIIFFVIAQLLIKRYSMLSETAKFSGTAVQCSGWFNIKCWDHLMPDRKSSRVLVSSSSDHTPSNTPSTR